MNGSRIMKNKKKKTRFPTLCMRFDVLRWPQRWEASPPAQLSHRVHGDGYGPHAGDERGDDRSSDDGRSDMEV